MPLRFTLMPIRRRRYADAIDAAIRYIAADTIYDYDYALLHYYYATFRRRHIY